MYLNFYLPTSVWQTKNISLAKIAMRREYYNIEYGRKPAQKALHVLRVWSL